MSDIIRGKNPGRPRRELFYGIHGIGKTTWAANAPDPIFICTEDGAEDAGPDRFPMCRTRHEAMAHLQWLIENEHNYKTLVIDSLDWLAKMIEQGTLEEAGKKSLRDFGFGDGYNRVASKVHAWLAQIDRLIQTKGMGVILIAHATSRTLTPPDQMPYERYEPDLPRRVSMLVQEWCDEVLFARYKIETVFMGESFGRKIYRARGGGERVVLCNEKPTHLAKNRLNLPDAIAMDRRAYDAAYRSGQIPTSVKDESLVDATADDSGIEHTESQQAESEQHP